MTKYVKFLMAFQHSLLMENFSPFFRIWAVLAMSINVYQGLWRLTSWQEFKEEEAANGHVG